MAMNFYNMVIAILSAITEGIKCLEGSWVVTFETSEWDEPTQAVRYWMYQILLDESGMKRLSELCVFYRDNPKFEWMPRIRSIRAMTEFPNWEQFRGGLTTELKKFS